MNDEQQNKLLALYEKSRDEQPSPQLDKNIRQAAKAALYRKRKRWIWGLSSAAVIVLSVSVVLKLPQHNPSFYMDSDEIKSRMSDHPERTKGLPNFKPKMQIQPGPDSLSEMESMPLEDVMPDRSWQESGDDSRGLNMPEQDFMSAPQDMPSIKKEKRQESKQRAMEKSKQMLESRRLKQAASAESSMLQVVFEIPKLPLELEQFLVQHESLKGEQNSNGMIILYANDKLIMSLNKEPESLRIKAWPGSEVLGVKINWRISPARLANCIPTAVYTRCDLNPWVKGFFEQQRLDHISWNQAYE